MTSKRCKNKNLVSFISFSFFGKAMGNNNQDKYNLYERKNIKQTGNDNNYYY